VPAEVHVFSAGDIPRDCSSIFVETSFLRWAMIGEIVSRNPAYSQAADFLHSLLVQMTCEVWTTPFVYEEILYGLLYDRLRREALNCDLASLTWASLKHEHAEMFDDLMGRHAHTTSSEVAHFLESNGVVVRLPRHALWEGTELGDQLVLYMSWLVSRYHIEPADALHIGCYAFDGADAIASTDLGFQRVDGIRVIAHRAT